MNTRVQNVYLIGGDDSPLVKIGTSQDVPARLRALRTSSPTPLQVLWQTEGGRHLEAALHEHFAEYRRHGEWFDFGNLDATALVSAAAPELAEALASGELRRRGSVDASPEYESLGLGMVVLLWNSSVADPQERLLLHALADQGGNQLVFVRDVDLHRKTQIPLHELPAVFDRLISQDLVRSASDLHRSDGSLVPGYWINVRLLRSLALPAIASPSESPFGGAA